MSHIKLEELNGCGLITLDREAALNAINHDMILDITKALLQWRDDDSIKQVVIEGAGEKAFCAGGDVKAVYYDGLAHKKGDSVGALIADFFYDEYRLNQLIFHYPKPYIALIDGISMGGGVGLSAHGSHRIVNEKLLFAMPETGIGLFPDVGGGYLLSRAPEFSGLYAGLTGHRMGASDALYLGYASHFVHSSKWGALRDALLKGQEIDAALAEHSRSWDEPSFLEMNEKDIAHFFDKSSLLDVFKALEEKAEADAFAAKTLSTLSRMSPTSMAMFWKQYHQAMVMEFDEIMIMEYRLSQACMHGHDFFEGIRALLIDKDKNPQWDPASVAEIDNKALNIIFESTPKKGDLTFL